MDEIRCLHWNIESKMSKIYIGIDPGVQTGFAYWCPVDKHWILRTGMLHEAFEWVKSFSMAGECLVRFEDARLRTFFGNS